MSIYSKDKSIMKTIRISQIENNNWDIDKIHDFLEGNAVSIELLKQLYDFMGDYLIPLIPKKRLNEIPKKQFIKTIKEMIK